MNYAKCLKRRLKRLHIVWYHSYDFLERQNCKERKEITGSLGLRMRGIDHIVGNFLEWWKCSKSWLQWWYYYCMHLSKLIKLYPKKREFYHLYIILKKKKEKECSGEWMKRQATDWDLGRRKYLQNTYLMMVLYSENKKNTYNSISRR